LHEGVGEKLLHVLAAERRAGQSDAGVPAYVLAEKRGFAAVDDLAEIAGIVEHRPYRSVAERLLPLLDRRIGDGFLKNRRRAAGFTDPDRRPRKSGRGVARQIAVPKLLADILPGGATVIPRPEQIHEQGLRMERHRIAHSALAGDVSRRRLLECAQRQQECEDLAGRHVRGDVVPIGRGRILLSLIEELAKVGIGGLEGAPGAGIESHVVEDGGILPVERGHESAEAAAEGMAGRRDVGCKRIGTLVDPGQFVIESQSEIGLVAIRRAGTQAEAVDRVVEEIAERVRIGPAVAEDGLALPEIGDRVEADGGIEPPVLSVAENGRIGDDRRRAKGSGHVEAGDMLPIAPIVGVHGKDGVHDVRIHLQIPCLKSSGPMRRGSSSGRPAYHRAKPVFRP
jgi:hypothetical protein